MNSKEFKASLQLSIPPAGLNPYLLALWYDAKGDWEKSHHIVQDMETREAALIHAYLHRKEGDIWNADYWYKRAGSKRPDSALDIEFESILNLMLQNRPI